MVDNLRARDFSIDLLRIFSLSLVLISHFGLRTYLPFGGYFDGTHGVIIFFMISGYCMRNSLQSRTIKKFISSRFFRLIPTLIVCVTLTSIIEFIFSDIRPDRIQSIRDYFFNLICLPAGNLDCDIVSLILKGRPVRYSWVDGAYWSLLVEIRFYLLLAVLHYVMRVKNIALTLVLLSVTAVFNFDLEIVSKGKDFLIYLSFFSYGYAFKSFLERSSNSLIPLIASYSAFVLNCFAGSEAISVVFDMNVLVSYSACFLIFSIVIAYCPNYEGIAFRHLGFLTYPIYLLHQDIGLIVIEVVRPYIGQINATFVAIGVAVVLATFVQRFLNQVKIFVRREFP